MTYLFAALAIEAVGRAGGEVVEQVRKQLGGARDHGRDRAARLRRHVAIVTAAAQREMILPSLIPIIVPVIVGISASRPSAAC